MSILYLVATPIGNLEDFSPRAVRILKEVSLIAAEDTRVTGKLLARFKIGTKKISYFDHNKAQKEAQILAALAKGDVALVSDAGTPGINDPGYKLVRAALAEGHRVSPIPGASAPIAALSVSGLPTDSFLYLGYLPRKSRERRSALKGIEALPYTLIFLVSPHRLVKTLADMEKILGNRKVAVARELTKMHEEIFRGDLRSAQKHFESQVRGEFTVVLAGKKAEKARWSKASLQVALEAGVAAGESPALLAKRVAKESGWQRRDVYKQISLIK